MASLTPVSAHHPAGLLPSGQLWLPQASLSACVRGYMVRNTLGHTLTAAQRVNYFPASPLCSLSWWFEGRSLTLQSDDPGRMPDERSPNTPLPGRWVLGGPQLRPSASWCPGPAHAMMVLFLPDALRMLTGLAPVDLADRFVDAEAVLPQDWLEICQQVQSLPDDRQRVDCLEKFLDPRWQTCRPDTHPGAQRVMDWATHLAQRVAASTAGRCMRTSERQIRGWSGMPLRELRGIGRSEQAFFDTLTTVDNGQTLRWADIAVGAGYSDQSHLCRVTKRITGFTPQVLYEGMQTEEAFWAYRLWTGA